MLLLLPCGLCLNYKGSCIPLLHMKKVEGLPCFSYDKVCPSSPYLYEETELHI